jgi:hypothetical protein
VLNADFDFPRYLGTLHADGLNLTRVFSGAYREDERSFNIVRNTLAPAPGRFLSPWARSEAPGYAGGGNKFDLTRWDDAYFERLKRFCRAAGERGVAVEYVLFCTYYDDSQWKLSPLCVEANVNGIGDVPRTEALTLSHPKMVAVQEAMVRKVVTELNGFDNVYFEICNEPYFHGVTLDWQRHIARKIVETEAALPNRHMIAQNIANGSAVIQDPDPNVSLFNFHYANPPDAVTANRKLEKAIGFDETGFRGTADLPYRTDGWEFLLAGGAVYNHLDYSFVIGHEDGSFPIPAKQPGGGGRTLRRQLSILKQFVEGFDFHKMRPEPDLILGGVPEGGVARSLVEEGKAVALYVRGGTRAELRLALAAGRWRAEWVNTKTGEVDKSEEVTHKTGECILKSPPYEEDIALRLRRHSARGKEEVEEKRGED